MTNEEFCKKWYVPSEKIFTDMGCSLEALITHFETHTTMRKTEMAHDLDTVIRQAIADHDDLMRLKAD